MDRKIFNDPESDLAFKKNGFVLLPFLGDVEVKKCMEIFETMPPAMDAKFYTSHLNKDENYRRSIHEKLGQILSAGAERLLHQYTTAYNYFMVKNSGAGSEVRLHQDWTLVDEDHFTSLIFWCPLTDTNENNGIFKYVKNSHLFIRNIRGTGIEPGYSSIMSEVENKFLTSVSVSAGQAIAFDHRLVHASSENLSGKTRVVAGTVLRPKESQFIHYVANPGSDQYNLYKGDQDFLLKFSFGDDPEACLAKTDIKRNMNPQISFAEFSELFEKFSSR